MKIYVLNKCQIHSTYAYRAPPYSFRWASIYGAIGGACDSQGVSVRVFGLRLLTFLLGFYMRVFRKFGVYGDTFEIMKSFYARGETF